VRDADVAQSPRIEEVIPAFHDFAQSAVLVAHNAPFDIGLLRQQEVHTGCSWDHPVVDTVLLSAVVFGISADHSLDALCSRLSIEIPARHRHTAKGDARATAEALIRLLPLLQGKGVETFGQLLNETSKFGRLLRDINSDHVRNAPEMSDSP
jgi:DNA polymerase-3 subunit epsilon